MNMDKAEQHEFLRLLQRYLQQILILIENNSSENLFDGTAELLFNVEELAEVLNLPVPIHIERRKSNPLGIPLKRLWLQYPYDDCARGFRVDSGTIGHFGRDKYLTIMQEARQVTISLMKIWIGIIPVWLEMDNNGPYSDNLFVPTPLQESILKQLEHRALKKEALAEACGYDPSRFYRPGGIRELMHLGKVDNKPGIGYYRPDAPPGCTQQTPN